ncbi:bifunctional metallophosphatase/5'-nucleotidase [Phreatobacter sp. AB_2022a]|uniref:bifunctional metallophosphatase/5'-nucleotidase n=1 Tax=Phreatobacter sp. AB_2022a TaxID=3003134 RepID=UPI0022874D89|nr:bifunctional UDP-sugar hydrolase/5'-nucleotidase [Phreatobacter sp. AB_2022a]MCZ0734605.1 bifunctional UDP-sugar hydrolase/5'-nucleotidase [Phreatobacter sp. AB_2022a]
MPLISRRDTLSVGLGAAVTGFAGADQAAAERRAPTLTLLLVNDIYKMGEENGRGGFARLNAVVKAERARGVPMLYVHAGDMFSPSLMSGFDQGAHTVELVNLAPPDVFVPGNHEFDFGPEAYAARRREAKFAYFAANMRDADGAPLPGHEDGRIFDLGVAKLGVFGVALPNTAEVSSSGDIRFSPTMETVQREAARLRRAGADLVVCCAHTDRADDLKIVRSRLVDVLLTGHDHDLALTYDGRTVMVESSEEGYYVTAIDLTLGTTGEGAERRTTFTPAFRVHDSRSVTPDPATLARVQEYEKLLAQELDVVIAVLSGELDSRTAIVRSQETAIGDLIADAMREATGADVAVINGGGIRGNRVYPAGHQLTRRDVLSELPFGNRTVVAPVSGADLKAAIENGVSQVEHRAGRFPQVSGLTAIVDRSRPAGDRVVAMTVGGAPLDPQRIYRVATNDFMLKGGDGYGMLGARVQDADLKGKLVASDVMVHARRLGTIAATTGGRIRFL